MDMLKNAGGKVLVIGSVVCALALAFAGSASAALTVEAKDFTEPVETQLGAAVPIVVGFLAAVFVVGYVIRWIMKRAKQAT